MIVARLGAGLIAAATLASALVPSAVAAEAPKVEDDIVVESKDGTPIVATLMLPGDASADNRVPAILKTHGWGGTRDTSTGGFNGDLLERGYALLTWDSRGFGDSGGEANVGAPGFEVEDAKALIDYLATRNEILLDAPGDPRLGWIGGSNAGGVQFNTAALDDRVDAIVPEISWGNLIHDLLPNGVVKNTWDLLLYGAGAAAGAADGLDSPAGPQTGIYAQQIHQAFVEGLATGDLSEQSREWFAFRSTTTRSRKVEAPTLIIQGTVDTLFAIEDAFENYLNLKDAGTPVKLITYCSGHTLGCSYPGGASGYPDGADGRRPIYQARILSWLDHYVKGLDVALGPEVEWQAQDGFYYGAPHYPLPGTNYVEGKKLATTIIGPGPGGGDGVLDGNPAPASELGTTAARDVVFGPAEEPTPILGIPRVKLAGSVTGVTAFLFFELVDVSPDGDRVTVDDQTMPLRLASGELKRSLDLHGISWILKPGHALELEITTGSLQYQVPRTGPYAVTLEAVTELPVTKSRAALRRITSP
jgi:ABC-2 type transport system ATP-binding protein